MASLVCIQCVAQSVASPACIQSVATPVPWKVNASQKCPWDGSVKFSVADFHGKKTAVIKTQL